MTTFLYTLSHDHYVRPTGQLYANELHQGHSVFLLLPQLWPIHNGDCEHFNGKFPKAGHWLNGSSGAYCITQSFFPQQGLLTTDYRLLMKSSYSMTPPPSILKLKVEMTDSFIMFHVQLTLHCPKQL